MVPAAVINIGNIFGSEMAASSTAAYPEIVAMEESASMLWARVIRGISSIARKDTPAAAKSEHSLAAVSGTPNPMRSEEHTSELQSPCNLVCRLLLEKKKNKTITTPLTELR